MTAWQDEHSRSPFGADPGRPTSRREAREAERRRAETMVEKPPHPSGVVDFEAHDFGPEFVPDQTFDVGDTQDIWQALTRGGQPGTARPEEQPAFRAGVPETPAQQTGPQSAVQGELMDRVREAVLRRQQEPEAIAPPAPQAHDAFRPQPVDRSVPAPHAPDLSASQSFDVAGGLSRRERRRLETADLREDGLPVELFDGRAAAPAPQQAPAAPAAPFDEYAEYERQYAEQHGRPAPQYDEDYYDEPYSPEPTIAIPVRAGAEPQRIDPGLLPQTYSEPAGDDALTFSSPVPQIRAEPQAQWPHAEAEAAFSEPDDDWDEVPTAFAAQPRPASAPMPFIEPQQGAAFREAQIGPPSEMTDLAGFEALIRKARQQPAGPTPAAPKAQPQRPAMAWADDDADEVQDGFGSLLSRQVQSSHGTSPALILPNDPQPVDLTQAVSGTGDIFVTGTMKLSNRFSSTGASEDHYDSHEIDRLYDATQDEPSAGVAPVRASKAVSGAPQNRVVTGKPGRGNLLPTVLAIVAGAMAVGVVTLLVGSWVFRIF